MESHNHPSFIEPYQGAATGVGGILRDVFTMGARPIALMNALRLRAPEHPKTAGFRCGRRRGYRAATAIAWACPPSRRLNFHPACYGNILVHAMA